MYGEFEHYELENTNCFYGSALIQSYIAEKKIPSTGLFIHKSANKYNQIFKVWPYSKDYSFVYLNQSLDYLFECFGKYENGGFPIKDTSLFVDLDLPWDTAEIS